MSLTLASAFVLVSVMRASASASLSAVAASTLARSRSISAVSLSRLARRWHWPWCGPRRAPARRHARLRRFRLELLGRVEVALDAVGALLDDLADARQRDPLQQEVERPKVSASHTSCGAKVAGSSGGNTLAVPSALRFRRCGSVIGLALLIKGLEVAGPDAWARERSCLGAKRTGFLRPMATHRSVAASR